MWGMHHFRKVDRSSCLHPARHISASIILLKSHYDVLGVTPKATQSDIKAAYYKLSMVHHPDKNKGADASATFRDITAAYEVLGNYRLRKLYDKGLLHSPGAEQATDVDDHPEAKFYQSRADRHKAPTAEGKTPIYDFDEWARQHYSQSFARRATAKVRWESSQRDKAIQKGELRTEFTMYLIFAVVIGFTLLTFHSSKSYDVDHTEESASRKRGTSMKI